MIEFLFIETCAIFTSFLKFLTYTRCRNDKKITRFLLCSLYLNHLCKKCIYIYLDLYDKTIQILFHK